MFAENLLESGGMRRDGRRGWATLASLSVQLSAVAVLALLPSLYPEIMAMGRPNPQSVPIFSQAPQVPEQQPGRNEIRSSSSQFSRPIQVANPRLPLGPPRTEVDPGPPMPPNIAIGPVGQNPINSLIGSAPPMVKAPPPSRPLILSHMDEGHLLRKVQPPYPQLARTAGIEGLVTLTAIISRTGEIESLRVISGHPMLASAARDAVSQWRYRPYILNGEPIEVETQITVNFKLRN